MRKGEGQRRKRGGEEEEGGTATLLKSCHVALIHPASLESGKGPEGLSQDRGPGSQTCTATHRYVHTLSFSLAHTYTQIQIISSSHTHTNIHIQMTLAHGAARGQFGE